MLIKILQAVQVETEQMYEQRKAGTGTLCEHILSGLKKVYRCPYDHGLKKSIYCLGIMSYYM